jgi:hypothetical protein
MNGRDASANCKLDGAPRALPAVERQLPSLRRRLGALAYDISYWFDGQ